MKTSESAAAENAKAVSQAQVILGIFALISVLLSVATGVLIRQLGGEPVEVQALATTIAAGDLTSSITLRRGGTFCLLASLDRMHLSLRTLVSQITNGSTSQISHICGIRIRREL
ncbi:hypothetical protein [Pantoea septica]|uniref:hypothetical protein n=1 Tax=Pantoea septica TaxID=472695 RepID=UPI0012EB1A29|nr:hypothetical protein [Pantoea septica]